MTCVSPAGNRTPVSRVTGGDTHHYTTEDFTGFNVVDRVIKSLVTLFCFRRACNARAFPTSDGRWERLRDGPKNIRAGDSAPL